MVTDTTTWNVKTHNITTTKKPTKMSKTDLTKEQRVRSGAREV